MTDSQSVPKRQRASNPSKHKKLPRLPKDASLTKRPLLRPPIVSPYASSSQPKVVYVSPRTPFLSAVKRVEKLLYLADKRDVQAATTLAHQRKRKRKSGQEGEDEIGAIAGIIEEKRRGGGKGESVVLKGTGKAVGRVLEIGMWFQKRDGFEVQLSTGTVGAVDDVEVLEEKQDDNADVSDDAMDIEGATADTENNKQTGSDAGLQPDEYQGAKEAVSGTRVRYLSMLEVAVSLQ